jgi:hypothetical protein
LHIQRPFFNPFASLSGGRGCSFPTPMPAERWRNPPAKPQARPNQESESKPESERARSPEPGRVQAGRARFALDPGVRVKGRARFALDTKSPSPRGRVRFFGHRSPSPRKSSIAVGLMIYIRARWTKASDPKQNGLCALPWLVVLQLQQLLSVCRSC